MRAMLLAAGLGTRMRPLTSRIAKPALPVLNRPLVHWTLERLAAAGVTDVIVNLHHRPATVRRAVTGMIVVDHRDRMAVLFEKEWNLRFATEHLPTADFVDTAPPAATD